MKSKQNQKKQKKAAAKKAKAAAKPANNLLFFAKRNKALLFFFFASTFFFIFQHYNSISWDFSAFALNAKYWAANGAYFELFRPPLAQFILSALGIAFGWAASEYIYIVLVSALFAFSSAKLAEILGINRALFYILSLNPYVLRFGLINGSELLSLSLLELFIAGIASKKSKKSSGHWLGLACLARYNLVLFLPLAVFYKNARKIAVNFAYFALPFIPWFLYNFIKTGNIFTSIADSFANNVFFRQYLNQQFNFGHLWLALNFLIPLAAIGVLHSACGIIAALFKKSRVGALRKILRVVFEERAGEIIIFIVLLGVLYSYNGIPIKGARYLFSITLPAAYFSVIGIEYISLKSLSLLKFSEAKLAIVALFIFLTVVSVPPILEEHESSAVYTDAIERISKLGLGECSIMSNSWVFLNYFGRVSSSSPWDSLIGYYISKGNYLVMFYHIPEPDYARNTELLHSFPVAYENKDFIIIGNSTSCAKAKAVDSTYISALNESVYLIRNETIDIEPCNLLFSGKIGRKACNIANLRWE